MRPYIISLLSLCIAGVALVAATSRGSSAENELTRIEADQQANVIRFFIEGEQKAVLNAEGLHVREGIRYGQDIIDYGPSGFDQRFGEAADAP